MNKKKPTRRIKKIVLIVLLGMVLAFCLFAGYFFLTLADVEFLKTQDPETTAIIEQRKAEAQKKRPEIENPSKMGRF